LGKVHPNGNFPFAREMQVLAYKAMPGGRLR
jgi:hypothetical protein